MKNGALEIAPSHYIVTGTERGNHQTQKENDDARENHPGDDKRRHTTASSRRTHEEHHDEGRGGHAPFAGEGPPVARVGAEGVLEA